MFKKAEIKDIRLNLALIGPSGSGKTYSALSIASGIGDRVAVIDSENRASSFYSRYFDFDVCSIDAPFSCDKYIQAFEYAIKEKYDVIIIDSLTQAWDGEDGVLEFFEDLKAKSSSKNNINLWKLAKEDHKKLKRLIFHSPIPVIVTIKSKENPVLLDKNQERVVNELRSIAEPRIQHDFITIFEMHRDPPRATIWKDWSHIFKDIQNNGPFLPNKEIGKKIKEYINLANPWKPSLDEFKQIKELRELIGWSQDKLQDYVYANYNKSVKDLEKQHFEALLTYLSNLLDQKIENFEKEKISIEKPMEV